MTHTTTVIFNGNQESATIDAVEESQRKMGADVTWEVIIDSAGTVATIISEYPAGEFTESNRHPALGTRKEDIIAVIRSGREE